MTAGDLQAQEPVSWQDIITKYGDARSRVEPDQYHDPCLKQSLPDTVALVAGPPRITIAIGRHFVAAPAGPDTVRAGLVGIACDYEGWLRRITYKVGDTFLQQQGKWKGSVPIIHFVSTDSALSPVFFQAGRLETDQQRVARERRATEAEYSAYVKAESERRSHAAAIEAAREIRINATDWPSDLKRAVLQRQVKLGMTAAMVREAWGNPKTINTTVTAAGRAEQWVYDAEYVYITNGTVTAIQTSR